MKFFLIIFIVLFLMFFFWRHVVAPFSEAETPPAADAHVEATAKENTSKMIQLSKAGIQSIGIATKSFIGTPIPASAVVWFDGKSCVYVEVEPLHFHKIEVTLKSFYNDAYEVDGIPLQAGLVIQGAQMLLSEEQRSSVEGTAE